MAEQAKSESFMSLVKKGNTSSAVAMAGNAVLALCKGGAFLFSGSGAMFASAMHSLADAINQGFVFVGSVLSEKKTDTSLPNRIWTGHQHFLHDCRDRGHDYGL